MTPEQRAAWIEGLIAKFPVLDVAWPEDVKAQWFALYEQLAEKAAEAEAALAAREAEVAGLREALEFYANPFGRYLDPDGDPISVPDFYAEMEFGDTARVALEATAPPQPAPDTEACRRSAPEVQAHAPAIVDGPRPSDADTTGTGAAPCV